MPGVELLLALRLELAPERVHPAHAIVLGRGRVAGAVDDGGEEGEVCLGGEEALRGRVEEREGAALAEGERLGQVGEKRLAGRAEEVGGERHVERLNERGGEDGSRRDRRCYCCAR